ncbi:MAG: lysoplasmalogenase [Proteobacteria bacterium]|nr:lysoplasmalogenase [Pseudomonadota bacterium]
MNFELELLTVAIIVCAVLHILAEYKGAQRKVYLLKPLTMLLIVVMGLILLPEKLDWYHYALLIGLLFSIGGDVALMWPSDKFMLGLVSFLTGHIFYISGLISGIELSLSWYVWVPLIILGSGMFLGLRSGLGRMQIPVLLYILVILIMSGTAWERHFQLELPQTYFALWGATLFILSDALLAWNRFRVKFKSAQLFILGTYYTAQWALAISLSQSDAVQMS